MGLYLVLDVSLMELVSSTPDAAKGSDGLELFHDAPLMAVGERDPKVSHSTNWYKPIKAET